MDFISEAVINKSNATWAPMIYIFILYLILPTFGSAIALRVLNVSRHSVRPIANIIVIGALLLFIFKGIPHYNSLVNTQ